MNLINIGSKTFKNYYNYFAKSSADSVNIAKRASKIYGMNPVQSAYVQSKAAVNGACKPFVQKAKDNSYSLDTLTNMIKTVKRKGLSSSKDCVGNAFKELSGINDVKAAINNQGTVGGIKEIFKTATRLVSSGGLFVAGAISPIPCGSVLGWVVGEKITEKCLGKPFTKQIQKLIK